MGREASQYCTIPHFEKRCVNQQRSKHGSGRDFLYHLQAYEVIDTAWNSGNSAHLHPPLSASITGPVSVQRFCTRVTVVDLTDGRPKYVVYSAKFKNMTVVGVISSSVSHDAEARNKVQYEFAKAIMIDPTKGYGEAEYSGVNWWCPVCGGENWAGWFKCLHCRGIVVYYDSLTHLLLNPIMHQAHKFVMNIVSTPAAASVRDQTPSFSLQTRCSRM